MLAHTQFDEVFRFNTRAHLSAKRVKDVAHTRSKHQLFFDLLLDQLQLQELQKVYPPQDNRALRELHQSIVNTTIPVVHKQSLILYLLCDLQTPEDEASAFAKACYLPEQYVTAIFGFWEMDRQEYRAALEHLTQPSLLPTFAPEILLQLLKNSKDPSLPLSYYQSVSPTLPIHSEVRTEYFKFLTRINVQQAFFASRREPDAHELFELIIETVLAEPEDQRRASAATDLVDLPLSMEEEEWLETYLTAKRDKIPGAADTLIMRKVVMGQGGEVLGKESRKRGHKVDGLDWHVLTNGMGVS